MSDESKTDKPDRKRAAKFVAYALLSFAALLLAAFSFWAYRMVAVWVSIGGSVPIARQMVTSLGWDGVAFAAITIGVPALCIFVAISMLASGRDRG